MALLSTEYPIGVHVDLDEGRYVEMGCLSCKEVGWARLSVATPLRYYMVSLNCRHCGEEFAEFDQFIGVRRMWVK